MPQDEVIATLYVVLGSAYVGDNHTDEWVAGIYPDADSAINAAKQHLREDLASQNEAEEWGERYRASRFNRNYDLNDAEGRAQIEKELGIQPSYNLTEDYIVFPAVVGEWLGSDAYTEIIFKASDGIKDKT